MTKTIQYGRFYLAWIIANLIGFMAGSVLGATNNGLVATLIPGYIGMLCGDLIFGAAIGLAQWFVLRNTNISVALFWWVLAYSIGIIFGARTGSLLTDRLANDWLLPQVVFAIFMGGWIGFSTVLPLSKIVSIPHLIGWMVISIAAWIVGESIAFASDFSHRAVPLVAVSISTLTGLPLLWFQHAKFTGYGSLLSRSRPGLNVIKSSE